MAAGAIGVQIEKLLLDSIFHIAARTIKLFIALGGREAFRPIASETFFWQVGDDEARVVLLMEHFGFADDPACPAPALASLILELDKFTGHSADQARFGARAKECFLDWSCKARL